MANVNKINGFTPAGYLSGAAYTGAARMYAIPTTDTTASYAIGDVVQSAGSADANGVMFVKKVPAASASSAIVLGVVVGVSVADASVSLVAASLDLTQTYILAGTRTAVRYVYVADDPNLLFECSVGSGGMVLTSAGKNFGLASFYTGADQTYAIDQSAYLAPASPYSNVVLANVNTTNTLPVRALGIRQTTDNTITATAAAGAYARVLCRFNNHEFGNATGTNFTSV